MMARPQQHHEPFLGSEPINRMGARTRAATSQRKRQSLRKRSPGAGFTMTPESGP